MFFLLGPLQAPQASYATELAQIETVALPDGSVMTLGPVSRVDVRFTEDARQVALVSGEAFFDVSRDESRRFAVEVGDTTVVVRGTQFDVRRSEGVVRVVVARGSVEVDAAAALRLQSASAVLRAGDQAEAPERVGLLSARPELVLSRVSPEAAGAWRQGHLSYIEAPLSELVADLNRYYAPGIRLSDPAIGRYRLTASFRADDIETFLSTLPDAAPVRLTRGPRHEVVISPAR
jgi:transmembrane sensor